MAGEADIGAGVLAPEDGVAAALVEVEAAALEDSVEDQPAVGERAEAGEEAE